MKKNVPILLCLILVSILSNAQDVTSTGGGEGETSTLILNWTIGEPVIETYSDTTYTITQGFQQGKLEVIKISEIESLNLKINVFPNPTSDYLSIQLEENFAEVHLSMTDLNGKTIDTDKICSKNYRYNMQNYEPGTYLLNIVVSKKMLTYKIIKK